jgi:hypothetical protein
MEAVAIWNSRWFWRRLELGAVLAVAFTALLVAMDWRVAGAVLAALSGLSVFLARWRLEALDAQEREARESRTRRVVIRILDALREQYFVTAPEAERHLHRVTLLVCRPGKRSGEPKRLEVFGRSGLFHQSTTTLLVDEDRREICEGVAGRIWFSGAMSTPQPLPPWPEDANDRAGQLAHARAGLLSLEKARLLNVKAVAFSGQVVRVRWQKWGVLLLDSCVDGFISKRKQTLLDRFARLLGQVLEEFQS